MALNGFAEEWTYRFLAAALADATSAGVEHWPISFLILEATPPLHLWPSGVGEPVTRIDFDLDGLQILDRCIDFSRAADDSS